MELGLGGLADIDRRTGGGGVAGRGRVGVRAVGS